MIKKLTLTLAFTLAFTLPAAAGKPNIHLRTTDYGGCNLAYVVLPMTAEKMAEIERHSGPEVAKIAERVARTGVRECLVRDVYVGRIFSEKGKQILTITTIIDPIAAKSLGNGGLIAPTF